MSKAGEIKNLTKLIKPHIGILLISVSTSRKTLKI